MNEAGVLGRYLPEFGRIVAQMQFNMYHSYTVDEHTLRAVGVIADIAAGRFAEDHPLSTAVLPLIDDREALFLAMLLHDTGKGGVGGQEKAGARAARAGLRAAWGWSARKIELVAWLVEHHLVMSDYRPEARHLRSRAPSPPSPASCETPERLRLLLVLTVADIRAVGPGVWNGWKGQLLRELYGATEALFRGGRGSDAAAHRCAATTRPPPTTPAPRWSRPTRRSRGLGRRHGGRLFRRLHGRRAAGALRPWRARGRAQGGAAAAAEIRADRNATEVVVAATDRRGLFADLAGASPALGANVVGARVFTSTRGQALDVFHLQDAAGQPFGADNPRVAGPAGRGAGGRRARRGRPAPSRAAPLDLGRAAAFAVAPAVSVDNEASDDGDGGGGLGPRPAGPAGSPGPHPRRPRPAADLRPRRRLWRAGGRRLLRHPPPP